MAVGNQSILSKRVVDSFGRMSSRLHVSKDCQITELPRDSKIQRSDRQLYQDSLIANLG